MNEHENESIYMKVKDTEGDERKINRHVRKD